ncbi:hypothetical protein A2Z41_02060 [Microgenomates group bacterium RBG_19FT_COMBO_39_10]|nr:MAG: hypothetical protein A2Z41_02060 [Microgenomates group bacterium RBG_19FT_COMBO_39_10]
MTKYLQLIKNTLEEYFVYRLNFLLWRFRSFILFLTLFFFWAAIYQGRGEIFGYQKAQMLTYVIGIAFLRGLVMSNRSTDLEADIYSGKINSFLVKPLSPRNFYFTRDLADKLLNLSFVLVEIGLVLYLFRPPFWFPQNPLNLLFFILLIFLSALLFFFINLIACSLSFWTESNWAPRWLIMLVVVEFMSGAFFPIDILPHWLARFILATPFPYLIYFPLKIWLEQVSIMEIIKVTGVMIFWLVMMFYLSRLVWRKGLRHYSAWGG